MEEIEHESSDPETAKRIDKYNDSIATHERDWREVETPLDLMDDELIEISTEVLETQREGLLSERLAFQQNTVRLAKARVEILESIQPELEERALKAEKELASVTAKTSKAMTKAGVGPESRPAAIHNQPEIAQRQFDFAVRQATPVIRAQKIADGATQAMDQNPKRVRESREQLVGAVSALKTFVLSEIGVSSV